MATVNEAKARTTTGDLRFGGLRICLLTSQRIDGILWGLRRYARTRFANGRSLHPTYNDVNIDVRWKGPSVTSADYAEVCEKS